MRNTLTLILRLGVVLAFLVVMPILSVPGVNRWVDEKLFPDAADNAELAITTTSGELDDLEVRTGDQVVDSRSESISTASGTGISAANRFPAGRPASSEARFGGAEEDEEKSIRSAVGLANLDQGQTHHIDRLAPTNEEIDNERFHSVQRQLQDLGVQYLVLEKWPGDRSLYRFHCRIAVPGSSAYARPFEASDADPIRAMQLVLSDVKTWCASHSSTTSTKLR